VPRLKDTHPKIKSPCRVHYYLRLHFLLTPDELAEAVRRPSAGWDAYYPPRTRTAPRRLYPSEPGFVDRMAMCAR
jgi:hypothetical protein